MVEVRAILDGGGFGLVGGDGGWGLKRRVLTMTEAMEF